MKHTTIIALIAMLGACAGPEAEAPDTTTEENNLSVVNKLYAAFAAGDIDAVKTAMAKDAVWNEAENSPYADGDPYIGPDAVVSGVIARADADWNDLSVTIDDTMVDGDKVVVLGRYTAENKMTGKSIDAQFAHVWTLKDGLVISFQQYADTAQLRDAMTIGRHDDQ